LSVFHFFLAATTSVFQGFGVDAQAQEIHDALVRCHQAGISNRRVALSAGISPSFITHFLAGRTGLGLQSYHRLREALIACGVLTTVDGKVREETATYRKGGRVRSIPLAGSVSAGKPNGTGSDVVVFEDWKQEGAEDEYEIFQVGDEVYARAIRNPANELIACRVQGDSMKPYYLPGDVLILERTADLALLRNDDHIVCEVPGDGATISVSLFLRHASPLTSRNR